MSVVSHSYFVWHSFRVSATDSRLISGVSFTSNRCSLPVIAKIGSIEKQCSTVKMLIEAMAFDNVGILCFTRNLVNEVLVALNNLGMQIEVYLPCKEDEIDTVNPGSPNPKLMTIASAENIHFSTVFVVGCDSEIIRVKPSEVLKAAITRATQNLYIFYDKQMPATFTSLSQSYYRSSIYRQNNSIIF